jgi:hypothetical protein
MQVRFQCYFRLREKLVLTKIIWDILRVKDNTYNTMHKENTILVLGLCGKFVKAVDLEPFLSFPILG